MNDYLNQEKDFPFLFDRCFHIMSIMKGVKVSNWWMTYAEGLGKKLLGHLTAIYSLHRGTNIVLHNKDEIKFIDFSSICILTRAALETYLTFYYIFCDSKNDSEKEFRFLIWDLAGYIERQGFLVELTESREIKARELEELTKVNEKIKLHPYFSSLTDSMKSRVLNGEWKMGNKVPDLAAFAGFNKQYIGTLYSHLCGHSHTSRASVMQVHRVADLSTEKELSLPDVGVATILLASFLIDYSTLFDEVRKALENERATYNCAKAWKKLGQDLKTSLLEVIEFISTELNIYSKSLSNVTTFESLNITKETKVKLLVKFSKNHFIDIKQIKEKEINTIGDLAEVIRLIRENKDLD